MADETYTPHKWWILFGIGLGVLMSTLDATIVNIALPTLVQDLQASFGTVQWVVLSYLLVLTSLPLGWHSWAIFMVKSVSTCRAW